MSADEGFRITQYAPTLDSACRELEERCPQGETFRLRFKRSAFHARAESYDRAEILVALDRADRVVGTVAWAEKDIEWRGRAHKASFYFDARVHPDFRRRGVARRLIAEAYARADRAGASFRYTYCVDDNRASQALAQLMGARLAGRYRYLVWPCFRPMRAQAATHASSPEEVHAGYRRLQGPFDFYCDPLQGGKLQGVVASLMNDARAGCSLWSNAGILEEVVERIPPYYRWIRSALETPLLRSKPWPHIPQPGQTLRSWIAYDFHAPTPASALDLMANANQLALERGIQFIYVVLPDPIPPWLWALRSASPRFFTPLIAYRLLIASPDSAEDVACTHPYVDVRDL